MTTWGTGESVPAGWFSPDPVQPLLLQQASKLIERLLSFCYCKNVNSRFPAARSSLATRWREASLDNQGFCVRRQAATLIGASPFQRWHGQEPLPALGPARVTERRNDHSINNLRLEAPSKR